METIKKIIIKREKRKYFEDLGKEVVLSKGRKYYIDRLDRDYHTEFGTIKKKDLAGTDGSVIRSNKGHEFVIFSPSFIDFYRKISRSAQTIPLKDIGLIISETGVNKNTSVIDAGAGSGALACALANIAKKVTTYEIRDDFAEIVKANIKFLGLKNVVLKKGSIYDPKNIRETADLLTLDVPEPWKAVDTAEKCLRTGGFLVAYSPSIPQVMDFVSEIRKRDTFIYLKTIEVMEREWEIKDRKVRPKSKSTIHSGFLVFVRKIKNGA